MQKIVIADDDRSTRLLLGKHLHKRGYMVVQASDGMRARTLLDDNPDVSLLITDVVMPMLDGRELVQGLRRDSRFAQLPVLVMSAEVKVGEIRRLLEMGASRFLAKPVDADQLIEEVEALLTPPNRASAKESA